MHLLYGLIAAVVLSVVAILILSLWGIPVVVVAFVALLGYFVAARKRDPEFGTVERGRRVEPTGRPRKASGGAHPTNERVGS